MAVLYVVRINNWRTGEVVTVCLSYNKLTGVWRPTSRSRKFLSALATLIGSMRKRWLAAWDTARADQTSFPRNRQARSQRTTIRWNLAHWQASCTRLQWVFRNEPCTERMVGTEWFSYYDWPKLYEFHFRWYYVLRMKRHKLWADKTQLKWIASSWRTDAGASVDYCIVCTE